VSACGLGLGNRGLQPGDLLDAASPGVTQKRLPRSFGTAIPEARAANGGGLFLLWWLRLLLLLLLWLLLRHRRAGQQAFQPFDLFSQRQPMIGNLIK
jgi:hypothetical protein